MKKFTQILIIGTILFSMTAVASAEMFDRSLKIGMLGDDVRFLQKRDQHDANPALGTGGSSLRSELRLFEASR